MELDPRVISNFKMVIVTRIKIEIIQKRQYEEICIFYYVLFGRSLIDLDYDYIYHTPNPTRTREMTRLCSYLKDATLNITNINLLSNVCLHLYI